MTNHCLRCHSVVPSDRPEVAIIPEDVVMFFDKLPTLGHGWSRWEIAHKSTAQPHLMIGVLAELRDGPSGDRRGNCVMSLRADGVVSGFVSSSELSASFPNHHIRLLTPKHIELAFDYCGFGDAIQEDGK